MMKLKSNATKAQIIEYIQSVLGNDKFVLQDKVLVDTANYSVKQYLKEKASVLRDEIMEVAKDLEEYILPQAKPVETKIKAVDKEVEEEPETEKPKAKAKVKVAKKKAPEAVAPYKLPEELETEDFGKLELVTEGIDSIEDVMKATDGGRNIFFAIRWTKADLKKFQYGASPDFAHVKEFNDDMDLHQALYFQEDKSAMYILSNQTEALGRVRNDDLEQIEGVRYVNGAEFGIYEMKQELTQEYLDTDQVDEEDVKELEEQEALEERDSKFKEQAKEVEQIIMQDKEEPKKSKEEPKKSKEEPTKTVKKIK